MAVVHYHCFGLFELLLVAEQEGSVLDGTESKKVEDDDRLIGHPFMRFPVENVANGDSFLFCGFFRETESVRFVCLGQEVADSFQRIFAGEEIDFGLQILGEEKGEDECLRMGMFVAEVERGLLGEDGLDLGAEGEEGRGVVLVVFKDLVEEGGLE